MKVVRIDGGMGRVICAVPAVEKLAKTNEVVVQTSHPWVFDNNPYVKEVFDMADNSIWEKYIKNGEYIVPEPYHNHLYYKQKHHLIQSFDYLINGEEEMTKPNLYISTKEEERSIKQIKIYKEENNVDKIIVLQPFGASSDPNKKYWDSSGRSLPYKFVQTLLTKIHDNIGILPMGFKPFSIYPTSTNFVHNGYGKEIREWVGLIKNADYFIGCDSVGQHIARSFNIPGTVFLGTTFRKNISYNDHFNIIQKPDFPIEYDPIRILEPELSNIRPFLYTEKEQDKIIKSVCEKIE